jgi:uncharacterized protein (DUF1330 family)
MPVAYLIADVEVTDPERYAGYTALSPAAVAAAGGEFLARGGRHQVLEGQWAPGRMVVVRFPSYEAAAAFYDSEKYLAARAARAGATSKFNMVVVEGVPAQ